MATLAFDSARYVGARIGIFDPSGRKVGRVSHLKNRELLVIVGAEVAVRRVVDAIGTGAISATIRRIARIAPSVPIAPIAPSVPIAPPAPSAPSVPIAPSDPAGEIDGGRGRARAGDHGAADRLQKAT